MSASHAYAWRKVRRSVRCLWPASVAAGEVVRPPSFYSPLIGTFSTICLAVGIGIATGMIAGTTGLEGSARGRMAILAGIIGAVLGYLGTSVLDGSVVIGVLAGALSAVLSCAVVSDVIAGAQRRGGTAALAVITVFVALVIAVICLVWPPFAILPAAFLAYLAWRRRQQADRKHAGLRVLR